MKTTRRHFLAATTAGLAARVLVPSLGLTAEAQRRGEISRNTGQQGGVYGRV